MSPRAALPDSGASTAAIDAPWIRAICGGSIGLVFLGAAVIAGSPVTTNDLFWHIKTGEHLVAVDGFPARDVFSYTATDLPWFLHEWLTQVLFYGMYELGGFPALRVFTAVMAVAILFVIWRFARRRLHGLTPPTIAVLCFAILGTCRYQTRPTLFSMLLFLSLLAWLARRRGPWRVRDATGVVACTLLWVNLHSVGLLAVIVYGAYLLGLVGRGWLATGRLRGCCSMAGFARHAITMGFALAATCASPSGWHIYGFAFQDKRDVMNFVTDEWGAFHFDFAANESLTPEAYGAILGILVVIIVTYVLTGVALNGARERRGHPAMPDPVAMMLLLLCLSGGLAARRFHWMLAVSLVLAWEHLQTLHRSGCLRLPLPDRRLLRAGAATVGIGLLGLHYHRDLRYEDRPLHAAALNADYYRRGVAASLDLPGIRFLREAGLTGNAFSHYGSGGMLSFHLHPAIQVFIDSRADLYRRELLLEFQAVRDGAPNQQEILDRHRTDIYYQHWDIAALREPAAWTRVYRGPDGEIWLRRHRRNRQNLDRCRTLYARAHAEPAPAAAASQVSQPPAPLSEPRPTRAGGGGG